jgi:NAD dependent epimerase/dehydratase family enzyme
VTTQREFAKTLAHVLHAPFFLPAAPAFVLKAFLGEQACLVLDDQAIDNSKLKQEGFTFQFPTLNQALEQLYGKN